MEELAPHFEISQDYIDDIREEALAEFGRILSMFYKWKESRNEKANYLALIEILAQ